VDSVDDELPASVPSAAFVTADNLVIDDQIFGVAARASACDGGGWAQVPPLGHRSSSWSRADVLTPGGRDRHRDVSGRQLLQTVADVTTSYDRRFPPEIDSR